MFMKKGLVVATEQIHTVAARGRDLMKFDKQSVLQACLPFMILLAWLVVGMLIFYVFESPAETHRQQMQLRRANKASLFGGADSAVTSKFGASVVEDTVVIDLSALQRQSTTPVSGGSGDSDDLIRGPTGLGNSDDQTAQLLRFFNKKFFYGSEDYNLLAIKASKSGAAGSQGQYLTLTIFFTNDTEARRKKTQLEDAGPENLKWDLPGSLYFCLAVVTTIGYGNLSPATNIGKFLCVVYAVFGIPLFLLVVDDMRKMLVRIACLLQRRLYRLAKCCEKHSTTIIVKSTRRLTGAKDFIAPSDEEIDRKEVRAATGVVAIICCIVFIFLPSILFVNVEGWDYLSALYFCFISLTTIGFGDLIAGQKSGGANKDNEFLYSCYRVVLCLWLFFGIAFVATLIHVMQMLLERLIARIKIGKASDDKGDTRDGAGGGGEQPETSVNLLDIIDHNLFSESEKCGSSKNGSNRADGHPMSTQRKKAPSLTVIDESSIGAHQTTGHSHQESKSDDRKNSNKSSKAVVEPTQHADF